MADRRKLTDSDIVADEKLLRWSKLQAIFQAKRTASFEWARADKLSVGLKDMKSKLTEVRDSYRRAGVVSRSPPHRCKHLRSEIRLPERKKPRVMLSIRIIRVVRQIAVVSVWTL